MANDMTSIEIDIAVYKRIESARTNFSETPNDVLRRLLNLEGAGEPTPPTHPGPETQPDTRPQPHGKAWSARGVILPHGTEIRMKYLRQSYAGSIFDGVWKARFAQCLAKGSSISCHCPAIVCSFSPTLCKRPQMSRPQPAEPTSSAVACTPPPETAWTDTNLNPKTPKSLRMSARPVFDSPSVRANSRV